MPETHTYTVFQYDELSDKAKARARDWYAGLAFNDSCDWEFVFEDAVRMAEILGIEMRTRPVKLMGGGTRYDPCIYFSGFWSQGDGACFEGTYRYKPGAAAEIAKETGKGYEWEGKVGEGDTELIRIATQLQEVQRRHFYKLAAEMRHNGHYCHSGCMDVSVEHSEDRYRDIGEDEKSIRQLMRDFADWIYAQLRAEYDYQTSDEAVEESIRANEYTFDESGNRRD